MRIHNKIKNKYLAVIYENQQKIKKLKKLIQKEIIKSKVDKKRGKNKN